MTAPQIKVKIQRRPTLKLKVLPKFPSSVTVESPLTLDRTGGNLEIGLSVTELRESLDPVYASLNFTQTGGVPITYESIFLDKIFTPEMFADADFDTDAGPAIQLAINAAGATNGKVELAAEYNVITPIVDSFGVYVEGKALRGSIINFTPASDNQICYRVRDAGEIVTGGGLKNVKFFAPDDTYTQTAIELEDVSNYVVQDVYCNGATSVPGIGNFWSGGAGSIGLRTRGREFIYVKNLVAFSDRPIVISDNPNSTIDIDVSSFDGLSLVANGHPGVEIEDGVIYTRLSFANIHVANATHGIYNSDTTSTSPSIGLEIRNFANEQCSDTSGYNVYLARPAAALLHTLSLTGYNLWDNTNNGIYLRNIKGANLNGIFYQGAGECLSTDNTVRGLSWRACLFQQGSTAAFGGQQKISGWTLGASQVLPYNADYHSSAEASKSLQLGFGGLVIEGQVSQNVTVIAQGNAGNVLLQLPSTAGTLVSNVQGGSNFSIGGVNGTLSWTGTLSAARGGFGADVSASSGVPLFATGVATFTGTSGSGNFARVTSPTFVTPTLGAASATSLASTTVTATTMTADLGVSTNAQTAFQSASTCSYYATSASASYPFDSAGRLILQSRGNANQSILFVSGSTPAIRGGISGTATASFLGAKENDAGAVYELAVLKTGIANNTATALFTVTVPNANHNAALFLDIMAFLGTGTDASESTRCASGSVAIARTAGAATVAVASTLEAAQIATVSGGGTLTLAYDISAISGANSATQTFTVRVTLVVTGTITDHSAMAHVRLLNGVASGITIAP